MPEDFSKNLIKEYKYWQIYIHKSQNYLGRCIVWCKREDATDLSEANPEEQQELFLILRDLHQALQKAFQADWLNYGFLGNVMRHLHGHVFPRYAKPQTFMGITFTDELYGQHYDDNKEVFVPEEVLGAIKDKLAEALK